MIALRRAWRSLVRAPSLASSAVGTFALGIGINVAVLASVDRLLFRPLPYRDPDRLFLIQQTDLESGQRVSFLPAKYVAEAKAQLDMIEDLAILGDSTGYFDLPHEEEDDRRAARRAGHRDQAAGRGAADDAAHAGRAGTADPTAARPRAADQADADQVDRGRRRLAGRAGREQPRRHDGPPACSTKC